MKITMMAFLPPISQVTLAPRLAAFLEKIRARPAWQRALERGGPYALVG